MLQIMQSIPAFEATGSNNQLRNEYGWKKSQIKTTTPELNIQNSKLKTQNSKLYALHPTQSPP
jgi:hypothetical protein